MTTYLHLVIQMRILYFDPAMSPRMINLGSGSSSGKTPLVKLRVGKTMSHRWAKMKVVQNHRLTPTQTV
jgi:hypothetical protein